MADSRMTERGASISITLNGEGREAPAGVTVAELLDHLDLRGRQVAVARNAEIVPRSDFETVRIEDGDRIVMDVETRELSVRVPEEELARRRDLWTPPPPNYTTGVMAKYAKLVSSASLGAVTG